MRIVVVSTQARLPAAKIGADSAVAIENEEWMEILNLVGEGEVQTA